MKHYLIDSENVGDFWIPLLELPADMAELIVFYTKNSPHMSYDSLIKLKESDRIVTFIKCYEGTNALDFQLCSELGYLIARNEGDDFIIVTNDTGYDAAVKYWRRKEYSVKRIAGKDSRTGSRRRGSTVKGDVAAEVSAILDKLVQMPDSDETTVSGEVPAGRTAVKAARKVTAADLYEEDDDLIEEETQETDLPGDSFEDAASDYEEEADVEEEEAGEEPEDAEAYDEESDDEDSDDDDSDDEDSDDEDSDDEDSDDEDSDDEDSDDEDSDDEDSEDEDSDDEDSDDEDSDDEDSDEEPNGAEVSAIEASDENDSDEELPAAGDLNDAEGGAEDQPDSAHADAPKAQEPVTRDLAAEETGEDGHEDKDFEGTFEADPEEIIAIVNCIGADNLAELHNQLIQFYGENGKSVYQSLKSGSLAIEKKGWDKEEKFLYYCALILRHSDEPEEALNEETITELAQFLLGAENKRKNLNSLRYALLKHYGKEKGRRYYFMLKPYVKALNQM